VAINTAAIKRPEFIREAAEEFGASTIIISIQAQQMEDGDYYAFTDNGRENTHRKVFEWAAQAVELGAGELLVTSINREGTGDGFDLDLVRRLAESVPIPVIASGGAGSLEHVRAVAVEGKVDAIGVASCLHFTHARSMIEHGVEFGSHGEFEILTEYRDTAKVDALTIAEIKQTLVGAEVPCRDWAAA
jgi:cyclase